MCGLSAKKDDGRLGMLRQRNAWDLVDCSRPFPKLPEIVKGSTLEGVVRVTVLQKLFLSKTCANETMAPRCS